MPYTYEHPHPAVTTDIVIFTIRQDALQVLLIKRAQEPFRGRWALPGGFVEPNESLDDGARRELEEEAGVRNVYLEQLHSFGRPDRDPRERVITVAYYALIPADRIVPRAASDAEDAGWFSVDNVPPLAFDHAEILAMARQRLIARLEHSTIVFQFMPAEFTLDDLQQVYEHILEAPVNKRNFRRKVLALNVLEETGDGKRVGRHRSAKLYRFVDHGGVDRIE